MFSVSSIFSSPLCLRASCHHISFTELVQTWCHFFLRLKPWHFNNFQCISYHLIDTPYLQYLRMMTQYFQKQKEKRGGIWPLLRMKPLLVRVVDILCHSDIDIYHMPVMYLPPITWHPAKVNLFATLNIIHFKIQQCLTILPFIEIPCTNYMSMSPLLSS